MIITMAHTKGGVGKSTLAWHLANSFDKEKVTIIDLDFHQTLRFVADIGNSSIKVLQPKTAEELLIILASTDIEEVIIIDVGGFDSDINRLALKHSDKILIPITEGITEVVGFKTFKVILEEINPRAEISVVLNNIHPLTKNFDIMKKAVSSEKISLLDQVIRNRKIYKTSMGRGQSVFNTAASEAAREDIERLRDELR